MANIKNPKQTLKFQLNQKALPEDKAMAKGLKVTGKDIKAAKNRIG
jgi:hypothetical protein